MVAWRRRRSVVNPCESKGKYCQTRGIRPIVPRVLLCESLCVLVCLAFLQKLLLSRFQSRHLSLHGKHIRTRSSFHISCSFRRDHRSGSLQPLVTAQCFSGWVYAQATTALQARRVTGRLNGISLESTVFPFHRELWVSVSQSYRVGSNRSSAHWATKSWALGEGLRQRAWLTVVTTPF